MESRRRRSSGIVVFGLAVRLALPGSSPEALSALAAPTEEAAVESDAVEAGERHPDLRDVRYSARGVDGRGAPRAGVTVWLAPSRSRPLHPAE